MNRAGKKQTDGDTPGIDPFEGLAAFQRQIEKLYFDADNERGWEKTFVWFVEEVGELARALHRNDQENLAEEFADVAAWLVSLASLRGVDMAEAAKKYDKPHN